MRPYIGRHERRTVTPELDRETIRREAVQRIRETHTGRHRGEVAAT